MIKQGLASGIIILLVSTTLVSGITSDVDTQPRSGIKQIGTIGGNHPPIYIEGNDNFTSENGVTGGNGTEEDPYIIEDWIIVDDGSASMGIFINNTDAFFVIINCTISDFSDKYDDGIRFNNVENGRIEDTQVYRNDNGIEVEQSTNIDITNCTCYENVGDKDSWWSSGIDCYNSSYITIMACEGYNNQFAGTSLVDVIHGVITNSIFYNNDDFGIELDGGLSLYNTVRNCKVFNNTWGIDVSTPDERHPSYHKILDCEIYDNGIESGGAGIRFWCIADVTVENCSIYHNKRGIDILLSSDNTIRNCKIYNHRINGSGIQEGIGITGFLGRRGGSFNNIVTDCDIFDNDGGITLFRSMNTKIHENNIINNGYRGISVVFYNTAVIKFNNIYGNGYDWEWGSGFWAEKSFINVRHNYWGADDGPKIYRLDYRANKYLVRDGHGDTVYRFWSIPFLRPWSTEPIPDAGVQ